MKKLILAEKPSLGETIAKAIDPKITKNKNGSYENDTIIVASLVGHVLTREPTKYDAKARWSLDRLPLDLDDMKYFEVPSRKDVVKKLKEEIKRADVDEIVSAGDPDPEGSYLVYEVLDYTNALKDKKKTLSRMWVTAYDKKTIQKAYNERRDLETDMNYINTAESRSYSDQYVGYNFSQLFSVISGPTFAVGRVMTPTLQLVRKRELEITNFVKEEFHTVNGTFDKSGTVFDAPYFCKEINNQRIPAKLFPSVKEKLTNKDFKVAEKKKEDKVENPQFLPNNNKVMQEMSKRFKMGAKKTTEDMQFLYENKFMSYPRAEEQHLPPDMAEIFEEIFEHFGTFPQFKEHKKNMVFDKKNKRIFDAEKAPVHYALTPRIKSQSEIDSLTPSQLKVFTFVLEQYMKAFMPAYKYEQTTISLENSLGATFRIIGKVETQKGFKEYKSTGKAGKKEDEDEEDGEKSEGDVLLPPLNEGDVLKLTKTKEKADWTKPPKLLNEADLLRYMSNIHAVYKSELEAMEEVDEEDIYKTKFQLGTQSTQAPTIEKLLAKEYMALNKEKRLETTDKGKYLIDKVIERFITIEMTAKFEKNMELIKKGEYDSKDFKKEIKAYVDKVIAELKPRGEAKMSKGEVIDKKCPKCAANLVQRKGRHGEYISCEKAPACDYKEGAVEQVSVGRDCPQCNQPLVEREGQYGKFVSCSAYPKCKFIEKAEKKEVVSTGENCPDCGSKLVTRMSKNGEFVGCSSFPKCKYTKFPEGGAKKVVTLSDKICTECGKPMILRKGKKGDFYGCSGYPACKSIVNA